MNKTFWTISRLSIAGLVATCAVGYALLAVTHKAAASTASAACGPAKAHTVAVDGAARIYRLPVSGSFRGPEYAYYGCTDSAGSMVLSAGRFSVRVRDVQLRGTMAGLIVSRFGVDTGSSTLIVVDLSKRRTLHTASTSYMVPRFDATLVAYVLTAKGNVAWSAVRSNSFAPGGVATIYRAVGSSVSVLDHGANVKAGSLKLRGHTLQWVDGGMKRHAQLP